MPSCSRARLLISISSSGSHADDESGVHNFASCASSSSDTGTAGIISSVKSHSGTSHADPFSCMRRRGASRDLLSLVRLSPALFNHTCPESKDVMIDQRHGVAKGPHSRPPLRRPAPAASGSRAFHSRFHHEDFLCYVSCVSTGGLFPESSERGRGRRD